MKKNYSKLRVGNATLCKTVRKCVAEGIRKFNHDLIKKMTKV